MLEFIGILIAFIIAWFFLKNVFAYLARCFPFTLICLFGIGGFMFLLSGLANLINSGTAWIITLVPTILSFIYDIRNLNDSDIDTIKNDVKRMKNTRYGYDENGREIDFYKGYKCCGNCKHNGRRHSGGDGWCEKSGYYNDTYIIPNSVTYGDQHEVNPKYCCRYWQHF